MRERVFVPGEDDAAVLALRAKVWGRDHPHTRAPFYDWLFRRTPGGPGSGIVLERDGQVLGFAGICHRRIRVEGCEARLCHGLEFMIDPDLTGMLAGRIALRIARRHDALVRQQGFLVNINFPNDRSRRMLTSDKLDFTNVLQPTLMVCPSPGFHLPQSGGRLPGRLAMAAAGAAAGIVLAARRRMAGTHGASVEPVDGFDERFDALWLDVCADGRIRIDRSSEALTWRYVGHPVYAYTILTAVSAGRLLGYLVMSPRELFGFETALVVDLQVAAGAHAAANALLIEGARRAGAAGAALLVGQVQRGTPADAAMRRCGFVAVPRRLDPKPFMLIARAYAPTAQTALIADKWSFAWGDMDVV